LVALCEEKRSDEVSLRVMVTRPLSNLTQRHKATKGEERNYDELRELDFLL